MSKYWLLGVLLAGCLVGCTTTEPKPTTAEAVVVEPELSAQEKRNRHIQQLLFAAERALARDRLLKPGYDNAYDRYASVLIMDPDNAEAVLGLQAIVLRYLDMARNAAQRSYFDDAQMYLNRASQIMPDDTAVQTLVAQQRESLAKPEPRPEAENAYILDRALLNSRSDEVKQQLAELAQSARANNHMVLIVAATDAQGRWLYQTMRKAVPGYLLRGDIQVGSPARIELLPPL
ncbi:hypothetical protein QWI17_20855 [Gilvimarinus sp. SDUM040013]|uniref:Lipoprotein n=1 Tax=Gilvimarinus gilvus TaxID=3058038 RepID=A0ABU4RSH9_9GAMM|nr:hypothetical protein [Gilvimarinus sp. SDUM040013]MDO3388309.1 hypothetical protein [Gilvimarinus sp. SDUM040013]MDX6847859.1 hypothetical protein [Gilvimarinus sp. SDUM040013]